MTNKTYCTQQDGNCKDCGLVNYGRDCRNNPIADVTDGYCNICDRPIIYCGHAANHHNAMAARINKARDVSEPVGSTDVMAFFGTVN